jgi:hypothetical protein
MGKTRQSADLVSENLILTDTVNDLIQVGSAVTIYGGSAGIVSARQFYGEFVGVSVGGGGVTSIIAGDGISINQSTGDVTITASGGGAGTVVNDTASNATRYPLFSSISSGQPSELYASSTKLNFNPSTGTLSSTIFTSLSDKTKKTNIKPINNALNIVKSIDGVYYNWIDDPNSNTKSIGLIAQDIEKVLPEVVTTNSDGLKTVSYGNIVALLIEAIKEQDTLIKNLYDKLNA